MIGTSIRWRPLILVAAFLLVGLVASVRTARAQANIDHCGTLGGDETWSAGGGVHVVTCDITVPAARRLTIEAGAIVKFAWRTSIFVDGALLVPGAEGNPVYLTALADDSVGGDSNANGPSAGQPEDWGRIVFRAGSDDGSILTRAVMRYSGYNGSDSSIGGPVLLMGASPQLSYLTLENNLYNAVEIDGGAWQTDAWDNTTVVYLVSGDITIPAANTLTIAPGMKLKFIRHVDIYVEGRLDAQGSEATPIHFTSLADDSVCGIGASGEAICDSNANGPSAGQPEEWGRIVFRAGSDDSSIVTRAVIRYAGYSGSNGGGPIRLTGASPHLAYITFDGNRYNGVQLDGDAVGTDILDNTTLVYVLAGDLTIPAANTLTIVPGMKLKFSRNQAIYVDGRLDAQGTQSAPIHFTSIADDSACGVGANNEPVCDTDANGPSAGARGDWRAIFFRAGSDDSSILTRTVLRHTGQFGEGPIVLSNASPVLATLTFADNVVNGVQIDGVEWQTDTWDNTTIVYSIRNGLIIPAANTLTIAPGMKLKLGERSTIVVDGRLDAQGGEATPIYFSALADDTLCGVGADNEAICDTNANGPSVGASHTWDDIFFRAGSDDASILSRTVIRFGTTAIRTEDAAPTIARSVIRDNDTGIERTGAASPLLVCNDIQDNLAVGVRNSNLTSVLQAENQWWGSAAGPTHSTNPLGDGQAVSDGVDFTPWGASSCVYPPPVAPADLVVIQGSGNNLVLTWRDNSPDESGFVVERTATTDGAWARLATTEANATRYIDSTPLCGTTYFYRVRAMRASDGQHSANSNDASGTTPDCPVVVPTTPSELSARAVVRGMIRLQWADNSGNESGFHIERQREGDSSWLRIGVTGANATEYLDTGLANGALYRYRVCAALQSANTCSPYSNTVQARTHFVTMLTPVDR